MIVLLALRSLRLRPARSLVLTVGFGLGVGVMAALLGVGDVILDQARAPALIGGGDVLIGAAAGRISDPQFVLSALRPGGPFAAAVRTASPSERTTLYLHHGGQAVPVRATGIIPTAARAMGEPTAPVAAWDDTAADRAWAVPDPDRVLHDIDRFHPIPDVPARAASWAEWLYFNGRSRSARFYLTFIAGPAQADGMRTLGVRLQLDRGGRLTNYASAAQVDGDSLVRQAPDLTSGPNQVRLTGRDYRLVLDLPAEHGVGRASGTLTVHVPPDRSIPPLVLHGARDWISGYVVPATSATLDGSISVDGEHLDFSGGQAYHDHNWGFWRGVSWQWGQVDGAGLSIVYGRVYPPPDAADPQRLPGFLVALAPDGPVGFATSVAIDETSSTPGGAPSRIVVRSASPSLPLTLAMDVEQTTVTAMRPGGVGNGLEFLQMRARYHVSGTAGGRAIDFTAPGSAETFRGAR